MHEYLIVNYTDYDQPGDPTPMRIVGFKEVIQETLKAMNDRLYCIAIYEVEEQIFLDLSVPRPLDE